MRDVDDVRGSTASGKDPGQDHGSPPYRSLGPDPDRDRGPVRVQITVVAPYLLPDGGCSWSTRRDPLVDRPRLVIPVWIKRSGSETDPCLYSETVVGPPSSKCSLMSPDPVESSTTRGLFGPRNILLSPVTPPSSTTHTCPSTRGLSLPPHKRIYGERGRTRTV